MLVYAHTKSFAFDDIFARLRHGHAPSTRRRTWASARPLPRRRWARAPSSRSTSGCPTPWRARRRSPPSSTRPRWWPRASTSSAACTRCSRAESLLVVASIGAIDGGHGGADRARAGRHQEGPRLLDGLASSASCSWGSAAGPGTRRLFHLTTHAFFKALMFLGSGSVIHACHHEQDMRKMGGLWKKLPITGTTFLVGVPRDRRPAVRLAASTARTRSSPRAWHSPPRPRLGRPRARRC